MKTTQRHVFWGFLVFLLLAAAATEATGGDGTILGEPPIAPGYMEMIRPPAPLEVPDVSLSVNPADRDASRNFYLTCYANATQPSHNWTGNVSTCTAGDTAAAFKDAVALRINYFRAMAGVPANITLYAAYNAVAQQAALMMSANNALNHSPPSTWSCYTAAGYDGASHSNLSLGSDGWEAVSRYMEDSGAGNSFVGHRRWVLYPQSQAMGTGDIPAASGYGSANALRVMDNYGAGRPATREEYVAWPPPGFVPYQVVYPRWSFAYDGADFSSAKVTVTQNGSLVPVTLQACVSGYGENTLVWSFDGISGWPKPGSDTSYDVSVNNVLTGGTPRNFSYRVTVFDPDVVDTQLSNDVPLNQVMTAPISQGTWAYYYFDVPGGQEYLDIDLYDMTADLNLYVRRDSKPTLSSYDCRPYLGGTVHEACNYNSPASGRWWIGVNNASTGTVSYTIRSRWGLCSNCLIFPSSATVKGLSGSGSILVATSAFKCPWAATSKAPWITITSGGSGSWFGLVNYSYTANHSGSARTGTIAISGNTFTLTQEKIKALPSWMLLLGD